MLEAQQALLSGVNVCFVRLAGTGRMSEVPDFWGVQEDVYCAVSLQATYSSVCGRDSSVLLLTRLQFSEM